MVMRIYRVRQYERGLLFRRDEFVGVLKPGCYVYLDPLRRLRMDKASIRDPWLVHKDLELIVRSGALKDKAVVADVKAHERALVWIDGRFVRILSPGLYALWKGFHEVRVEVVDVRAPWLPHKDLDVIVRSGALEGQARVLDLKDYERALVWIEGRFHSVLKPGLYVLWTIFRDVRVEVVDAREPRLIRNDLPAVLEGKGAKDALNVLTLEAGHTGLYFKDGEYVATLAPGTHAFWKGVGKVCLFTIDSREQVLDVSGQEMMTADKVTLRLNAVVTFRVADPVKTVSVTEDYKQSLYRDVQLALRAALGTRDLDTLLADKDGFVREVEGVVKDRATAFGLDVKAFGVRDVILPGEMKELLNKVTEARKAAEAALITRREETAAMRMQANTAKLLEGSPTLMRLRELEVLEKVAGHGKLNIVVGEKGLTERITQLL